MTSRNRLNRPFLPSAEPMPADATQRALRQCVHFAVLSLCGFGLAACASQAPSTTSGPGNGRYFDPILGVWASPRVVADGEPIPRGGGGYLVGRPYIVGGRSYIPMANPRGYSVTGTASWYGDAFHGRRTANGEIFDKGSISAAHPTLPLPSYVRVTNLRNGWSLIVRVNDRGPYHGGRVMDVSQRVAETLDFKAAGTARIRVDYLGPAGLRGVDDARLVSTLRTDGTPAHLDGVGDGPMVADAGAPIGQIVPLFPPPLRPPLRRAAFAARSVAAPLLPPPPVVPLPDGAPSAPPAGPVGLQPVDPLRLERRDRHVRPRAGGHDPFFRPLGAHAGPLPQGPLSRMSLAPGPLRRRSPGQTDQHGDVGSPQPDPPH